MANVWIVTCAVCFCFNEFLLIQNVNCADITVMSRANRNNKCNGFRCVTSGICLSYEKRCDGTVDCADGSDEFNDCKTEVECPGFLYTCDYGACIEKDKVCDGKKDCRDNSDEARCISRVPEKISSNCKSNEFECLSGQCISIDEKCNGVADCLDRSDETKETCLNMNCPGFTYICEYGACVDGFAECDGIRQCMDNSDENHCTNFTEVTPKPTVKPTKPTILTPVAVGCILPQHPENGQWEINGGAKASPGIKVAQSTVLKIDCDPKYKLSSENKYMLCLGEDWTVKMPTCLKLCPTLYSSEVTKVSCYDKNLVLIKCDEASDGSMAKFECAPYYEPSDRNTIHTVNRYCYSGEWDLPAPKCVPVCGEKRVSAEPLLVNGKSVTRGDYPWTAVIYQKDKSTNTIEFVCGGSVLTQRVILTAAHCAVDNNVAPLNPSEIKVGVGKYYSKYKDRRDTEAQYLDIWKVQVHESYRGESQKYGSDIAFLITREKLLLSKVVQPVCYQGLQNIHLTDKMTGVVTGWGWTEANGNPSDELKEIDIPFKDEATCNAELPSEWAAQYLTYDKFCAGHYNRSIAVCHGDSGGGLVFPYLGRYYIHGIVSVAKSKGQGGECDIQLSALYTKVTKHYDLVERIASQYK